MKINMEPDAGTVIESLGTYLPPQSISTEEILSGCRKPIRFPLEKMTGIKTRRMAGQQEFSIDLARKAVIDCLSRSKYRPEEIELLICCNISRYDGPNRISFEPSTAVRLRHELGFPNAVVFDITNACAGMFTGIYIVNALIASGAIGCGMIVSGEYITHLTQTAQRDMEGFMDTRLPCLTLGDAGAALILEKASGKHVGFQVFDLQTFGRYSRFCIAGASENGGMIMFTDSVNLTDVAVKAGATHALKALEKAGWQPDSFQYLIMHQTSSMTMNSARREINQLLNSNIFQDNNTINNLEHRGNTASTSHFVAIADQIRNNRIQSGDKVVFSISASGLTIGAALYTFDDLPEKMRQPEMPPNSVSKTNAVIRRPAIPFNGPRVRIKSVGIIPDGEMSGTNTMEMAKQAAGNCLQHSACPSGAIDLLIYCGVYRTDYLLEPAYAALLAGELNINAAIPASGDDTTLAFDIFNGSTGFLNACFVAQQMLAAKTCQTAMIVAAECENNTDEMQNERVGLRQTASALILDAPAGGNQGFSRFYFHYQTDLLNDCMTYCSTRDVKPHLHVEKSGNLEALYINCILTAVQQLLESEGIGINAIDWVFPPLISPDFIIRLSDALHVPLNKFVQAASEGPDLFTSSLPFALNHALENNIVQPGDTGLMIAVGSGIQVGCAVYFF